jgi:hypothetical protein
MKMKNLLLALQDESDKILSHQSPTIKPIEKPEVPNSSKPKGKSKRAKSVVLSPA